MVQLRTQRTALILYGVLLVLPTIVLGGLAWRQIEREYELDHAAVPGKAKNVAARFVRSIGDRLDALLSYEASRSFTVYGDLMISPDTNLTEGTPLTSPLVRERRPQSIQAWFAFDLRREAGIDFWGGAKSDDLELETKYEPPVRELLNQYVSEIGQPRMIWRWEEPAIQDVSLLQVAFNRKHKRDADCLQYHNSDLAKKMVTLEVTPFHVQFFVDSTGEPRLVATRKVTLGQLPEIEQYGQCYQGLSQGMYLLQGFLIDPNWFFRDLPADLATTVLDPTQRFVPWQGPPCCGDATDFHAEIHLLADLPYIETDDPEELSYAPMHIAVDTAVIDSTFRDKRQRFLGLVAMLFLSLGTGMWLLLRSVRRDLEQAARTENFVAAVTHELRTPLTSIKMYGEMLLDGETTGADKQREYYKRIVRATERLGTLVERVLEKSRLSAGGTRPEPGDLNDFVSSLGRQLAQYGPEGDLRLELDPELPDVLMTPESVTSIVSNLVENARKYAPVDPTVPGAEPILVRTRRADGEVVLEVLDRGPGVAEAERNRIFEAFYRVGNEATRTARGAGLGLHLVLLQARSVGGDAGCRAREGGGSVFWVQFAPASSAA
ncbi:MAG TPA: HAMP domain-containing sensor histidine kinase [Planctomycetota bacterium]|nr:HAMP domain-containing sensor histidine kinase [Planctomycetota bacterium]